ncbi:MULTISPECIES: VWA domain-containing protein [Dietzia]|uniref:VWA domain-containing protein n=2 Tax=Dietzia TaxID=37914 RepID=A0ABN2J056_9ACTN|nr:MULTISPECIES: VWA domain-containing protein [Dietzia]MBC7294850.1 VWA domain-containing protein [Dietzia sp.]MBB1038144.1 VWA domain-containing protein [Dietzia natronolimnaea]MBB1047991.1 VWA domain-containing protein [Dietzia cercidiphylli]MBB1054764.1 VWA domain-containing protein [Dietzia sp. B44]MBB1056738.1 VWA domain-containing protein [Dietzia sp. B19]
MSLSEFQHPLWLVLVVVPLALAIGYVIALRSKRRRTVRFGNFGVLRTVDRGGRRWFTHVPAVLLILSLLALVVALAGPQKEQKVPRNRATVMLVVDVSLSMESTDVAPSRLEAAQQAATTFANNLTPGVNLGLVSYAGTASMLVAPTTDRGPVVRAVERLRLDERTATGEAIYTATQAVTTFTESLGGTDQAPPARIVLLSDGKETVPADPTEERGAFTAAERAEEAGIPISTISFGTLYGTVDIQGRPQPVPVDDASLRTIAEISGGDFFTASSLEELDSVYRTLEEQIGFEWKKADASRPWLVIGSLLAMLAAAGSLVAHRRIP